MREADVIVLGAGISGCIAAALLAHKGNRVILISKDGGTAHHLPESWIYNIPFSIKNLGIEDKILPALKKQSRCVFCSPDHEHTIEFSIRDRQAMQKGDVVWVNRNQLDQILLKTALDVGAIFYPFSRITNCEISATEVSVHAEVQNEHCEFRAPHIIDATGKAAFLSQHLKLPMDERKLDARVAYFSHFELQSGMPEEMRIVSIDGGYLFCIPVSDRRLSIGCVIAENVIDSNSTPDEIFASATALSSYITHLIAQATRVLPVIAAKNFQRTCLKPAEARYRLVGDAAAFLDPFFCPGIDFAFFSAEQAVQTIENNAPQNYEVVIKEWLESSKLSVYEKIEQSEWKGIIRLFADPHLPCVVPLMLTQSFCQLRRDNLLFKDGIQSARRAYEVASC